MGITACSAPREAQLTIAPQPSMSSVPVTNNIPLNLESRDLRTAQFVAVVDSGRKDVQPIHSTSNLRLVLEDVLSRQLNSQGYTIVKDSDQTLRIDLLDALVKVKHSMFTHAMEANVQIQLVAKNSKDKFVKRYIGKSTKEGPLSASPEDMEIELNNLLNALLQEMANDKQLNLFMTGNS